MSGIPPKNGTKPVNWKHEADKALCSVADAALGDQERVVDLQFDSDSYNNRNRIRLLTVKSSDETGAGVYGQTRRALIGIANQLCALANRQELRMSVMKVLATIVGLNVIARLASDGVKGSRTNGGLPRNPDETLIEALRLAGVAPAMKARDKKGSKSFYACTPIDPSEPRWAEAAELWKALTSQYHGFLGEDAHGRERTMQEVCDDVIQGEKDAMEKSAEAAQKREDGIVRLPSAEVSKDDRKEVLAAMERDGVDPKNSTEVGVFWMTQFRLAQSTLTAIVDDAIALTGTD